MKYFLSILIPLVFSSLNAQTILQEFTTDAQLEHDFELSGVMGSGAAFFDFNNDDFEDVYLIGGSLPDHLFKNNGDGTFSDVTTEAGIFHPDIRTLGVTTGDLDNDGYREIIISTFIDHKYIIYENNGDGTFTDISENCGVYDTWDNHPDKFRSFSPTLGDINLDGYLDLYFSNWVDSGTIVLDTLINEYEFQYFGASNRLYLNNGDLTFTDVTNTYGVTEDGCTLSSVFSDFDNDRDMDLLVTNDFGIWDDPDALYRNDYPNIPMADISESSGFDTELYGMGIGVGDYDRDGDLDYYKTSIGSAVLMNNQVDETFLELSQEAGVKDTYVVNGEPPNVSVHWGAGFTDLDLDGNLDLVVAKGRIGLNFIFPSIDSMPDKIWHNQGDGTFTDASDWFDNPNYLWSRGLSISDYDNDGDTDLLFTNTKGIHENQFLMGGSKLYRNNTDGSKNWLKIKVQGTVNNRDGFGTHLTIFVNGVSWLHEIGGGGQGHNSQHSSVAHFGLDDAATVDSLIISWPGDLTPRQVFYDVPVNHYLRIIEGQTDWEVIQGTTASNDPIADETLNPEVFPNPINDNVLNIKISEFANRGNIIELDLFNVTGSKLISQKIDSVDSVINIEGLSNGVYFLRFNELGKIISKKIIINR